MSPVISLEEFIEHRGGGPIREAFRREVRGYNCRLVLLTVRGCVNQFGSVSCLGDRGSVFHILSFFGQPCRRWSTFPRNHAPATNRVFRFAQKCPNHETRRGNEKVFPLITHNYALSGADLPTSKEKKLFAGCSQNCSQCSNPTQSLISNPTNGLASRPGERSVPC